MVLPVQQRPAEGYNCETKRMERMSEATMTQADKEMREGNHLRDIAATKSGIVDALVMQGCQAFASTSATASTRAGSKRVS